MPARRPDAIGETATLRLMLRRFLRGRTDPAEDPRPRPADLPWQKAPAPSSPPLAEVTVDPETLPPLSNGHVDPADPYQLIAATHRQVIVWFKEQLGITADYALVDLSVTRAFHSNKKQARSFALLPLGSGRTQARREVFTRYTGGGTSGNIGSTEYAALAIEAQALQEPLRLVFADSPDFTQEDEHLLDAVVAFINRA